MQIFRHNMPILIIESLNKDNLETIPTLNEGNNDMEALYERESRIYLNNVLESLSSGEDPSSSESVFLSYSDRIPDLPDWVEIQRYFKLVPLIQVSTTLENIPNLTEIRHVDAVIPVGKGVVTKISSFTQDYNPYIGEFPLLLNETGSLVKTDNDNTNGSGVIIAILSTGIDETHPMLDDQDDDWSTINDPKIIDSYDAWDGGITDDQNGRGTALASVAAGTGAVGGRLETDLSFTYPYPYETDPEYETQVNTTINIGTQMGLAPGASLFDVKITNNAGTSYNEGVAIAGIEWAVDHGADVILLDDLPSATSAIISVIEAATSRGALVIVPAGDFVPPGGYDDDNIAPYYTINSPASAPTALTVGATTETNSLWVQSERGPVPVTEHSKPDVVAPGAFMLGASIEFSTSEGSNPGGWQGDPGDIDDTLYFDVFSSTAMAAAVTAGVSARLLEAYPGASATAIKIALRKGATDLGFNEMAQGKGKISLAESLNILEAAPKQANNWVGNTYKKGFTVPIVNYADFSGKRILIDGSWSTSTLSFPGGGPYDWSQQTNGNLSTLGVASNWQHPYDDTANQYTWYNVSYQGASQVRITLDNLTLATGDNFTIYRSSTPNGPLTTVYGPATSNSSTTSSSTTTDVYFYFRWGSDGDGYTTGQSVFGIYGSVDLWFYADTAQPGGTFEFGSLATQLTNLGAVVEYWYANSADAPPTSMLLEYYDIYFLGQPLAVTTTGIPGEYYQWMSGNLTNYLNAGGRVLFIGDQENQYYNNATESLGVTWHYGGGGGPTTDIVNHTLTTYPFTIEELLIDAPYSYFTGTATTLVHEAGKATIKYYDQNNGKAVFVADEDVFNDELWDNPFPTNPNPGRYNNSQLAMNIFYWLSDINYQSGERDDGGEEHFELISYEYRPIMTDEDLWEIEIVLQNIGNFTSQAWAAFGFDYTPTSYTLGFGAIGNPDGVMDTAGEDNANDAWQLPADGDINTIQTDTIIEFYYNISENYPVSQIAMPYIEITASGMDRDTAECLLLLNGYQIGPIYETNTSTGGSGVMYYPIDPTSRLQQYNNAVEISVPDSIDLTLESFRIVGYNFSNSLGTQHTVTSSIAPNQDAVITFQYTPPDLEGPAYYEPEIIFTPYNMTHAQISPGYASSLFKMLDLTVDYGLIEPGYYDELGTQVYAIPKTTRQGDLPLLYDITPGSLSSSSSTKIVQFPGDIRVDGLTVMSSRIVDDPSLRLSGTITSVAGLGNYSEASLGISSYIAANLAPEIFLINDTWASTVQLNMNYLNHTSIGPILQVDIPQTQSPTTLSGTLTLISNGTSLYAIPLQITISNPKSSFLLLDFLDVTQDPSGYLDRDYDKLWDQLYEMWQIAVGAGYDIDSLSQAWYLYGHRTHDDSVSADPFDFLDKHVCSVPLEEDLPYEGLIGVDLADTFDPGYLDDYFTRGGNLVQLGIGGPTPANGDHLGPDFTADIEYHDREEEMTTLVSGTDSANPLMNTVNQLFYLGGGYMIVDQESYDEQLTYDVITGQNWLFSGPVVAPNRDIAFIYHDAVYPDRFGYDQGQYTSLTQTYKGLKVVVGSASMTQSWFLEQTDYWAYGSMKYAAEQNVIAEVFSVDLGNRKFVENIFRVGGNKAPTIESINMSTPHVGPGDYVTVRATVSDDQENPSELTVLCPEKITPGMTYINCSYDSNSSVFTGSFAVVDTTLIDNWNIYVIDDLYRMTEAVDGVKHFLIPEMNVKPVAWIPFNDEMNYYSVIDVEQGELLSFAFYYDDFEDGDAIICNVSLVYYFNEEETEIVSSELFAGLGQGIFLVDTTNLRSGTHIVFAYVTDTDGGTAEYQLAGFNIGKGTLYKPKPSAGFNPTPIIVTGGSALGIAAVVGGGWYFLLHRRGLGIGDLSSSIRDRLRRD
ncbi:MAG: S8 family serine peptidase [Candidatus Thorarchaeota archaeon]